MALRSNATRLSTPATNTAPRTSRMPPPQVRDEPPEDENLHATAQATDELTRDLTPAPIQTKAADPTPDATTDADHGVKGGRRGPRNTAGVDKRAINEELRELAKAARALKDEEAETLGKRTLELREEIEAEFAPRRQEIIDRHTELSALLAKALF